MGNCICCPQRPKRKQFPGIGRSLGGGPQPRDNTEERAVPNKKAGSTLQDEAVDGRRGTDVQSDGKEIHRAAAAKTAEVWAAAPVANTSRSKKLSNRAVLEEASYAERRHRDADDMANARAYN